MLTITGIDRVFNLFDDAAERATHEVCEASLQEHDMPASSLPESKHRTPPGTAAPIAPQDAP